MDAKPNLLFVFADQMRGMALGCAGNVDVRTPAIDSLARDGLRLTNCIATAPVCGPSRATLFTGLYPTTNRVLGNDFPLPTGLATLGTIAGANGYRTGYIGKWHLDGVPRSKFTPPGPRRHGFDFWATYNCTHDYFHPRYYRDSPEVIEAPGYEPQVQTDLALDFLDQHPADAPFSLVLSWGPPHDPYDQVPAGYRALYDPNTLTLRPNVPTQPPGARAHGRDCRRTLADYYAAITALDDQLARLLTKLEQRGLARNTVVVFTSDHGDMLCSHGWMRKQAPYEESLSVAFLLRWPDVISPGSVAEVLLGTVDVLPTLIGLLGWKCSAVFDGKALSTALVGDTSDAANSALISNYLTYHFRDYHLLDDVQLNEAQWGYMPEWRGVRTRQHTYVELVGRRPWLLFDNRADPYQMRNMVDRAEHRGLQSQLASSLSSWLTKTSDPFLRSREMIVASGLEDVLAERTRLMGSTGLTDQAAS